MSLSEHPASPSFPPEPGSLWDTILREMPGFLVAVDDELRIRYVNRPPAGVRPNEVLATPLTDWVAESERETLGRALETARVERRRVPLDVLGMGPRGMESLYSGELVPYEAAGERGLFLVAMDVTPQLKAESHSDLLVTAVEQASEVVLVADREGVIEYVNPAFERVTGYTQDEAIGQHTRLLKSGKETPEFYRHLWDTIVSGRTWYGQVTNRRKDGTLYEEEMSISPVRDHKGVIAHFVAVKRDRTEVKELERQLEHAQRVELLGELTGTVAHDFNNLLTALVASLDLAKDRVGEDSEALEDMATARDAVTRAVALTGKLLSFSRKQGVEPRGVDAALHLSALSDVLRRLAGERVKLELEPNGPCPVMADPHEMEQIVINLVVNARDAVMPAGGTVRVSASSVEQGDIPAGVFPSQSAAQFLALTVSDTGHGMSPEERARIFDPFYTTKEKGTGLGLPSVLRIVRRLGGDVRVESARGSGATFTVFLPLASPEVGSTSTADFPVGRRERRRTSRQKASILLVDDDPAVRSATRRALERFGHEVMVAEDATTAFGIFEQLASGAPDLLLTDVVLPGISGPELATEMRERMPGLPVIFASGYSDQESSLLLGRENWSRFLAKPFSIDELYAVVSDALGESLPDAARLRA